MGANAINAISILGSGWLGLSLAERFVTQGYRLKISTRFPDRLSKLAALPGESCVVDICKPLYDIDVFLQLDTLIVSITSKDINGFERLVRKIEASAIQSVLFVSSTSVYPVNCKVVSVALGEELSDHPLVIIENLFRQSDYFTRPLPALPD